MKKFLSLGLTLVLLLSLFSGCNQTANPGETTAATDAPVNDTISVGFGRVDITPTESVPIGGHQDERHSENIVDQLFATCIAITDSTGNTILLYHLDLLAAYQSALMARNKIARALGINGLQIIIGTVHNHSGPKLDGVSHAYIDEYNEQMPNWLLEAAETAMADRKTVTGMYITKTNPVGLNFVRHHILADGSKTGWASPANQSAVAHVFDPDNTQG